MYGLSRERRDSSAACRASDWDCQSIQNQLGLVLNTALAVDPNDESILSDNGRLSMTRSFS